MMPLSLRNKVLLSLLILALLPLLVLTYFSFSGVALLGEEVTERSVEALDRQAADALETRALEVALQVEGFLAGVVSDLGALSLLPPNQANYLAFSRAHDATLWRRTGTNRAPGAEHLTLPLYRELGFVATTGEELVMIRDGVVVKPGRQTPPQRTRFGPDPYVARTLARGTGVVDVSHLIGRHVSKAEQLRGAATPEEAVEGAEYQGIVRFSMALPAQGGRPAGVVTLALDHRHLMEFTQHLTPSGPRRILFPSYDSGNYAFMFDDEGWMIAHPKYWDLRGYDATGRLVPALRQDSTPEQLAAGPPFNLLQAGFIHPNYPQVAAAVRQGHSGVVDVTNVGGSRKIMAYAPIRFRHGDYAQHGVFGGVTIGAEVSQFHRSALSVADLIRQTSRRLATRSVVVMALTGLFAVVLAYLLARSITDPLSRLMEGTRQMALGRQIPRVTVHRRDEIGALTDAFNTMSRQLGHRNERLLKTLTALRRSRREILRERNFKEAVFENIETGILTLDYAWRVTSRNTPVNLMLDLDPASEVVDLRVLFARWPDLLAAIEEARRLDSTHQWSRYVATTGGQRQATFRLSLLALHRGEGGGHILTVEDLTERVNLRQRIARMERLASLGRLAAGIAHEVRNPLTGVSLLLDDLHDRVLSQDEDRRLIRSALDEIERLERLVTELLHFAAIPKVEYAPGDVGRILRQSVQLIRHQCEARSIVVREEYVEPLPEFPVDADKLKQAFLNLLGNAYDAMPDGGELVVRTALHDGAVGIFIADSGQGIRADLLPLIFEPFFTTKGQGTGLGLSITHTIVAEHGGRIDVESREGVGTQFTVWLPIITERGATPAAA